MGMHFEDLGLDPCHKLLFAPNRNEHLEKASKRTGQGHRRLWRALLSPKPKTLSSSFECLEHLYKTKQPQNMLQSLLRASKVFHFWIVSLVLLVKFFQILSTFDFLPSHSRGNSGSKPSVTGLRPSQLAISLLCPWLFTFPEARFAMCFSVRYHLLSSSGRFLVAA